MRTLIYIIAFFALLVTLNACKKLNGLSGIQLVATSNSIKTGQLDSLALVGAAATDSVKWAVSPIAGLNNIYFKNNHAVVSFNQTGSYTVTATLNNTPYSTTIAVTQADTTRTTATHYPLTGDAITLTSHYSKSPGSDSAYVYFTAQTNKFYYCLNSYLTYNVSLTGGFTLNIVDMVKPATTACQVGSTRLTTAAIALRQNVVNNYLGAGTYPVTVTLNGATYTGNVVVTATDITFNWGYTSGVSITPMHITR